ncbi:hypothetical protein CGUA_03530 [Corynebacterium guangdongense]|nr:hypothetical protein CGUA_03530 [Corynebacterium guangdongense]
MTASIATDASATLRLAPGIQVFIRDAGAIQFGLDATRTGVFELPSQPAVDVDRVAAVLMRLLTPTPATETLVSLHAVGLEFTVAGDLIDDLLAFRVLQRVAEAPVYLVGDSALARATADILRASGATVRHPVIDESEAHFIAAAHRSAPVLLVDRLPASRRLAPVLSRTRTVWLSGAVLDSHGMVGPVRLKGAGPCPMCVDLHRADADPAWGPVLAQLDGRAPIPDPAVVAATAACLATLTAQLAGLPAPPGARRADPVPGAVTELDATGVVRSYRLEPHPRCPVCFYLGPRP